MSLNYKKLSKKPVIFLRLTGVKFSEFVEICERIKPLWDEKVESKKQSIGRSRCLRTLEDKVLALLLYYRTYITHEFYRLFIWLTQFQCMSFVQITRTPASKENNDQKG